MSFAICSAGVFGKFLPHLELVSMYLKFYESQKLYFVFEGLLH